MQPDLKPQKPSKQRQSQSKELQKSGQGGPPAIILAALLGVGAIAILPKLAQQPVQRTQTTTPQGAVGISRDQGKIYVWWRGVTVSAQQFWFDGLPATASCDPQNCTLLMRDGAQQVYFRWFNNDERRWYYFQCPANYDGQFQGIPYTGK